MRSIIDMFTSVSSGSWPALARLKSASLRFEAARPACARARLPSRRTRAAFDARPWRWRRCSARNAATSHCAPFCALAGSRLSYDSVKASTTSRSRPVRGSRIGVVTMFTLMSRLQALEHRARIVVEVRIQVVLLRHLAQVAVGQHDALEVLHVLVGIARRRPTSPPAIARSTARRSRRAPTTCRCRAVKSDSRIASTAIGIATPNSSALRRAIAWR